MGITGFGPQPVAEAAPGVAAAQVLVDKKKKGPSSMYTCEPCAPEPELLAAFKACTPCQLCELFADRKQVAGNHTL